MAPKATKGKGEGSSPGMVVTLVFFILATIGLGISTYTGYSEQEGKQASITKLTAEKKSLEKDRDWQKYQALYYLANAGPFVKPEDQPTLKVFEDQYKANTLGPEAERAEFKKIRDNIEQSTAWDNAQAKANKPFVQWIVDQRNDYQKLEGQIAGLTKAKETAELRQKQAEDTLESAKKTYADSLAKQNVKEADDKDFLVKTLNERNAIIDNLSKEKEVIVRKNDEERKKIQADLDRAKNDLTAAREQLRYKEAELAQAKQKGTETPREWRTDWKIVSISPDGNLAYINLGSADNVQPQLTFSVHGTDLNRKPLPVSKGSVEVLNVVGAHVSQVRITGIKDRARDPILQQDVLYNPTWDPHLKKHVAITGLVDLTGDGRDSLQEFMRNLERQGIVVDAYVDLRALNEEPLDMAKAIKGRGIGVQTDYLIIGDGTEYLSDSPANLRFRKNLDEVVKAMNGTAKQNGVTVVGLRRYLEMIGYRVPRVSDRTTTYRPTLPLADQPKEQPKDPMNPMPMPMEQPKDAPPKEAPKDPAPPAPNKDMGM